MEEPVFIIWSMRKVSRVLLSISALIFASLPAAHAGFNAENNY